MRDLFHPRQMGSVVMKTVMRILRTKLLSELMIGYKQKIDGRSTVNRALMLRFAVQRMLIGRLRLLYAEE
ncbi:hypothetical protein DRO33_04895 [Candidatus Bathyarchaeota archaeon]|nr:MAG: hypothetical protein DRO33_04895 [Candidatus Bathyarchaeota archaeon]